MKSSQLMTDTFGLNNFLLVEKLKNYLIVSENVIILSLTSEIVTEIFDFLLSAEILLQEISDEPLELAHSPNLEFKIKVNSTPKGWIASAFIKPKEDSFAIFLEDCSSVFQYGYFISKDKLYQHTKPHHDGLISMFFEQRRFILETENLPSFLTVLIRKFDCFEAMIFECDFAVFKAPFTPQFYLKTAAKDLQRVNRLRAVVGFNYEIVEFPADVHTDERKSELLRCEWSQDSLHFFERDKIAETQALQFLTTLSGIKLSHYLKSYDIKTSAILSIVYAVLKKNWQVFAENLKLKVLENFDLHITTQTDWFAVELTVPKAAYPLTPWQIITMLKRGSLFIPLDDGTVGILPEIWYDELCRLSELGHQEDEKWKIPFAQALHADSLFSGTKDAGFSELVAKLKSISGLTPQLPPSTFKTNLRSYQQYGLAWLLFLEKHHLGGILADDMGLGKTIQVLAMLETLRVENINTTAAPSLIVVPRTLIEQWIDECKKLAPELSIIFLRRKNAENFRSLNLTGNIFIASYGFVRSNVEIFEAHKFKLLVLDEAQLVKNSATRTFQALAQLRADTIVALTGTPIENRLEDLFSIFDLVSPGLIPSHLRTLAVDSNLERKKAFFHGMRPFILRRIKSEVLQELPEKSEQRVVLPLAKEQAKVYQEVRRIYAEKLDQVDSHTDFFNYRPEFIVGLLRLRQLACHASLIDSKKYLKLDSTKVDFVLRKAVDIVIAGKKAVIFSHFSQFLKIIAKEFRSAGIDYNYMDGESAARSTIVESFKAEKNTHFFLMTTKVGGYGLNLTEADTCFLLDPWWNPAVEKQAIDRLHRMGQKKKILIYKLIGKNTIEEKMLELQKIKSETAAMLEPTGSDFLQNMSFDDFKYIFKN